MSDNCISPPYGEKTHDLDQVARWAARKKVLIVDDDFAFADLTRMYLEENGYEVELAGDGVQGIKKIMVSDYSVILCNMVMPNLAGDMFYTAVQRVNPTFAPASSSSRATREIARWTSSFAVSGHSFCGSPFARTY